MAYQQSSFKQTDNTGNFAQVSSRIVSSKYHPHSYSTQNQRNFTENIVESRLQYETTGSEQVILSGVSDLSNLRNLKNILLSLQSDWLS